MKLLPVVPALLILGTALPAHAEEEDPLGHALTLVQMLLKEATADMPAEQRDQISALGKDLAAMARRESASGSGGELQARKDLTAMGLRYYDQQQFLDAVRRNDELAVQLYVEGRGVDLSGRGADGRSALELARANRNERLQALLSRNLPAAR